MGSIPLEDCVISFDLKNKNFKPFTFELSSPRIDKTFLIQAASKQDMDDWVESIKSAKNFYAISTPFALEHKIHVDFKSETGFIV